MTGVINEGTDTTTYSDDETIERIKNGEIKDAATVFNYLTFERFNWSNETCIKCMMEDFKREIAACYEDRLQYEPGSWEHQPQQRRRRKRSTEYYNCYWCGSCYK